MKTTADRSVVSVRGLGVQARRDGDWRPITYDVSLDVGAGEICGIVGETGAGKTLTTRAVLGLLPRGTRAVGQVDIASREPNPAGGQAGREAVQLGRDVTLVQQNPMTALDPLRRVGVQLVESVLYHGTHSAESARDRAGHLLRRLQFPDPERVMKLFPHQLSGGMAQRVLIAAALMPRPRLVIVDEPTSALDANIRVEVLSLLRNAVQEEGAAALLVSHDLALVGRFCDAIVVMYAGQVVERGPTESVLSRPAHPYSEALIASSISPNARRRAHLETIPGAPPRPESRPAGCVFEPRCRYAFCRCVDERPELVNDPSVPDAACHLVVLGRRERKPVQQ